MSESKLREISTDFAVKVIKLWIIKTHRMFKWNFLDAKNSTKKQSFRSERLFFHYGISLLDGSVASSEGSSVSAGWVVSSVWMSGFSSRTALAG